MAMGKYDRFNKRDRDLSYCHCVVAVFQVAVFCHNVSVIAAQGYLHSNFQTNSVVQESSFTRSQDQVITRTAKLVLDDRTGIITQTEVVRFEPPYLDFGAQSIGMPVMRLVHLYNPSKTKTMKLISISASTLHFHSSFFDEKVIMPNCNTTFEVVFLARVVGNVENTLFIHTEDGAFSYQVFGVGVPNPYRLRPYLGARVSINSSFSPLISMHNPTGLPLQVTEIYTSSGYLHLQLPAGLHEANKKSWEIPPYETKPLMKATFLGQVVNNHTAFIRIKTNLSDIKQYLILPMEVEVSSVPGIYSSLELLDFGTLRSQDKPKTLNLFLLNSGTRDVQISSITAQPPNPALHIDFKTIKLKPSEALYTRVANISFNASAVSSESHWSGKIVVKTREKSYSKISIPYQASILDGSLEYDEASTMFYTPEDESRSLKRNISLTNNFNFPLVILRLEIPTETQKYFKVLNFTEQTSVPAHSTTKPFAVECFPSTLQTHSGDLAHHLILHTNASTFSMPLHAYSGLLQFTVGEDMSQKLDFGLVGTSENHSVLLTVHNHRNPIPISIVGWKTSLEQVHLTPLFLTRNDEKREYFEEEITQVNLPSNWSLTIKVTFFASELETTVMGVVNIETKYQTMDIPVLAKVAVGSLVIIPNKISFPPSFPGLTVHHSFTVKSSFPQITKIEGLISTDKRFYYRKLKNVPSEVAPGQEVKLGKIYFDPRQDCKPDRCYVGLPTSTTAGHRWLTTLNLGKDAPEVDFKQYQTFLERYRDTVKATPESSIISISTTLHTIDLEVSGTLYWPSLLDTKEIEFPLTHIGKKSISLVTLENPSDFPVIVQILPISLYPQPGVALDTIEWSNLSGKPGFLTQNLEVFKIALPPNSSSQDTTSQMTWLDYTLNGKTNHSCLNVFVNPGQKQTIEITFAPINSTLVSTAILFRNNLTGLEALHVEGKGVKEVLKLGGKISNRKKDSLRFKLTESLLRDCNPEERKENPSFTVRKSFTAKNMGLLPMQVLYMMVGNYPCEGYGFRILECDPFLLESNATREIIIAFTPDFTSSQVMRTLRIVTSQNSVLTFNLNVTLPHHMLPACQAAIPRPPWERSLYYVITILMVVLFIGVLLAAYLEAINILEPYVRSYQLRESGDRDGTAKLKPFNLRNIANEFISNPTSEISSSNSTLKESNFLTWMKLLFHQILSFDLLQLFRNFRTFAWSKPNVDPSSREDLENSSSKTEDTVSPITPSPTTSTQNGKVRGRNSGRKTKSQTATTLKEFRRARTHRPVMKPVIHDDLTWDAPLPSPTPYKPEKVHKSRTNSSGSSIESERSRRGSGSSGPCDSDKNKQISDQIDVSKRKRKNKLMRQQSFSRENDDSSSTTTEKSSEDFEILEKPAYFDDPRNFGVRDQQSNTSAHSNKENEFNHGVEPIYTTSHEQGVRRRHGRAPVPVKHDVPITIKQRPVKNKSPSSSLYETSSNEEPMWEFAKVKQDNGFDEGMRILSKQTMENDNRIREKLPYATKESFQKLSGESRSSSYNSVKSSSSVDSTKKIKQKVKSNPTITIKPKLSKTQSVPSSDVPKFTSVAEPTYNRRHSNRVSSEFSMFSSQGSLDAVSPPPLDVTSKMPAWNHFGQHTFSLTEDLIPHPSQSPLPLSNPQTWAPYGSSYNPPTSWNNIPHLNPPPGSPTTPKFHNMNQWNTPPQTTQSPVTSSTHAIWSVSTPVTMDEDRDAENDILKGLKSIWNSDLNQSGRSDMF
nr:transmembrane protein 131 [Ciona intestinalis]|eukprot:XP_002123137.3 transmembrane protein 131 [Ciona intestinalis]